MTNLQHMVQLALSENGGLAEIQNFLDKHGIHGSGFDSGVEVLSASQNKIILHTAFHHMNDDGFYDGWTEHKLIIRPDFISAFLLTISGRNKNCIKDYISETFYLWLDEEIPFIWNYRLNEEIN